MGRPWMALLVAGLLASCGRKPADTGPVAQAPPIACPTDAEPRFGPEPAGWWCMAYDEIGRAVAHGTRWERHPSGTPAQRYAAKQGVEHGMQWRWREDGTTYERGQWRDGRREGWWVLLSTDRATRSEGPMVAGRRSGMWTEIDLATGHRVVGPYVEGRRDGLFHDMEEDRVVRERLYRQDRLLHVRAR